MNILVVDDKQENRYLLDVLLNGNGFHTESASNGVEALEKLKEKPFDLIISDILMPEMDGYQLCRECKLDKKLKNIIFIFYTATYTDDKDELFALKLGADCFIRKPVEPDKFIEMIRDVVKEAEKGKKKSRKIALKQEAEVFKNYSERLVNKLEKKMLELEESEKKYREIFNNANDAIYLHSLDENKMPGKFLEVNDVACEMLGYTREELLQMTPQEIDDSSTKEEKPVIIRKLLNEERITFIQNHLSRSGETIPVEISSHLFALNGRNLVLSIARDIRDRLQRERDLLMAEKDWQKTFDAMDEVLLIIDLGNNILNINKRGIELLGMPRREITGKKCHTIFHDRQGPISTCPFVEAIKLQRSTKTEYYDERRQKYFSAKASPIFDKNNELVKMLIVVDDITERKNVENELRVYQQNLEKLVEERTAKLEKKNEELQSYIRIFEHREFRIKELRDEVKSLKERLNTD